MARCVGAEAAIVWGKHQGKAGKIVNAPPGLFPDQRWPPRVPLRWPIPGTTALLAPPLPNRKERMVAGEVQTSFVFRLLHLFAPPPQRKSSAKLKPERDPDAVEAGTRRPGLRGAAHGGRAAGQHEPDSVPAARPAAGEEQRLRGAVSPRSLPGGWRLGAGRGEDGGSGRWARARGGVSGWRPRDAEGASAGTQGRLSRRAAVAEDAEGGG